MYECKYCDYKSEFKQNYIKHLKTKKHINNKHIHKENKKIDSNTNNRINPQLTANDIKSIKQRTETVLLMSNSDNQMYCEYCFKTFLTNKHITSHHIRSCLLIPDNIKNKLIIKHNSNPRTKNKIPMVDIIQKPNKIINNMYTNNGNINNVNATTITNIKLNPFGEESIDHISDEKLNEIIKADTEIMYLLCQEISKVDTNHNAYIDTRKNLAYFIDKNSDIKITRIKTYITQFCNLWMDKMKLLQQLYPSKFTSHNKLLFNDTYDMYTCKITKDNMYDMEYIEKNHKELLNKYTDDVNIALINTNKKSKELLELVKQDFTKTV
jgi:hypothetical protein